MTKETAVRKFPRREADVAALARQIVSGLTAETDDFPSPPLPPAALQSLLDTYKRTHEAVVQARAALALAVDEKDAALENLVLGMKADLRYAEYAVKHDGAKLKSLGWRKRKPRSPTPVPGQTSQLVIVREDLGSIALEWKKPKDGGPVATYLVQVSHAGKGDWRTASLCFETEITLAEQERGVQLEYQVVALNKAGEGLPSNVVAAVL
jgi:hypothetical protein